MPRGRSRNRSLPRQAQQIPFQVSSIQSIPREGLLGRRASEILPPRNTPLTGLLGQRVMGRTASSSTSSRHPLDEDTGPSLPSQIPSRIPTTSREGLIGTEPGSLAKKLVREFEQLQTAHPYVPYGAYVKRQAEDLLNRSRRGQRQPGQPWNLRTTFSDDELRLILTDRPFAKKVLKAYDPSFRETNPTRDDVTRFMTLVGQNEGRRIYPQVEAGQHFPALGQDIAARVKESANARINSRSDMARRADLMLGQSSRLAPLSPLHTTAKELLQGNDPRESLNLGKQEIREAGRIDVPRKIAPYLKKASQTPQAFLEQYELNYAPLIENFRQEAARDFLENDLPRINNQFAHRGAFHSGAREAALNKARADKEKRIEQEISRMLVHAREEGMKNYHQYRSGHLKQAEIAGHAHQAQQDSRLRSAEALRVNSGTEQAALHQQLSALNQMGRTEQEQAQNELNVRQQEHREEMERPFLQHMRKAAIASNAPHPHPQLSPASINPPPPSVYGLASGLIGQMSGLMGQTPQTQSHARGGHVRRGYAAGDSVARAASQLQDMAKHIQETPEEAEMRQSAQSFKNYRANPMADYLFAMGSHQLANLNNSPMQTYGEGSQLGMNAYKNAQAANLSAQEKYNNLIGKINQTKMYQRDFLARHHQTMKNHEEMLRHHQAQEAESRRAHDLAREIALEKLGASQKETNPNLPSFSSKEAEKSYYHRQRKLLDKFDDTVALTKEAQKTISALENVYNQGIGPTGPIEGLKPEILLRATNDQQTIANRRIFEKLVGEKVLERMAEQKGPQTDQDREYIARTVASLKDNPDTIKKYIDMQKKIIGRNSEYVNYIESEIAKGIPIDKAEKQWRDYVEANPLFPKEGSTQEGNVSMIDPQGNPLNVPKEEVEEVLSLGGKLVE